MQQLLRALAALLYAHIRPTVVRTASDKGWPLSAFIRVRPRPKNLTLSLCAALLFAFFLGATYAPAAHAAPRPAPRAAPAPQETPWREERTKYFAILYAPGGEATAKQYAGFADGIYDELATLFSYQPAAPITLRLFPTVDSYLVANPQARNTPGIVAHADFRRHEVVVVLPQTASQSEVEVENNIRHELTHLIAAELSDNRLNTGFQEAIAQYVEHPAGELEQRVALLQRAVDAGALLKWSDTDDRNAIYGSPEVGYPQMLSIAAFLVQRSGFVTFRDFLTLSARSSGYRSALERAYGTDADTLEQEWLKWLPSYLGGGYRQSAVSSYDLAHAKDLLAQGRYAEAQTEIERALDWLSKNKETPGLNAGAVESEARDLLDQSERGQAAESAAADARAALERGEYERAQQLVDEAAAAYDALGDARQREVLAAFAERARRGIAANALLAQAYAEAQRLQYPQARTSAEQAAAELDALGDSGRATQARTLSRTLDSRQTLIGLTLLAIGLGGVAGSLIGRWRMREAEVW